MDPSTEEFSRPDDMTMLSRDDVFEENIDTCDEVENLQNSFLEAVHDENVQPKMQCLMMDSSFSMVTMQGEGSGIEWETTHSSRSTTPWPSEAGHVPASPGNNSAGKIIFVMDEGFLTKQKKTKDKAHGVKVNQEIMSGSLDNVSGRPELVGFSEPNVKQDVDQFEQQTPDPPQDKEQKLFRLVSEGSEILNIIVPTKVVTLDEEESNVMVENLSYLEASTIVKAQDDVTELQNEAPLSSAVAPKVLPSLDPPGAPLSKPLVKEQPSNVDYFEAFSLIDAQAPGGPTVSDQNKPEETSLETATLPKGTVDNNTIPSEEDNADKISLVELTSELLDDVFYGSSDHSSATTARADYKRIPSKLSLKSTGDTLFGSQEDVLTPIYLPEGPPKIIDPILLEEPKAMAFLYTDLYEEATGSRKKEEDTESVSSEKSFHSRHSDREARGYLEKYVLIDETPVLEVEQNEKAQLSEDTPRIITQDFYELVELVTKPDVTPLSDSEEVTDFFRSSASSSPCTLEPLSRFAADDETQTVITNKAKAKKQVLIVAEKEPEFTEELPGDFPLDDSDWERTFESTISVEEEDNAYPQNVEVQLPVAPPKKKAPTCLALEALTPVILQNEMQAGVKEEQEEEKEAADENVVEESTSLSQELLPSADTDVKMNRLSEPEIEATVIVSTDECSSSVDEKNATLESSVPETVDQAESTNEEKTQEPAKDKGQCIIL